MTMATKNQIKLIEEFARDYYSTVRGYSGRGMDGKRCLGVTVARVDLREALAAAKRLKSLGAMASDAMGIGTIIYWPGVSAEGWREDTSELDPESVRQIRSALWARGES